MAGPWEKYAAPAESGPWAKYGATVAPAPEAEEPFAAKMGRQVLNAGAGAIRGAGSIGATLMAPHDMLNDALMGDRGKNLSSLVTGLEKPSRNAERRNDMTAALGSMGADTDSLAFGAGKLGGEIAGTLGAGGVLANAGARVLPAGAAPVLDAIRTAGMSAGGVGGKAGVAIRAAGGGITGAASAGLVNPEDIAGGAAVGAALPGVLQAGGKAGSKVAEVARGMFASKEARAGAEIAKALDLKTPQAVNAAIAQLNAARELVPGSKPTAAQALRTPQAGILQRVVSDGAGGGALRDQMVAQNAARMAALERVAPVDPRGFRTAQEDFGTAALNTIRTGDATAKRATSAVYQSIPQDETAFYLPDFAPIRQSMFPVQGIGKRESVDRIIKAAEDVGMIDLPAIKASRSGAQSETLAQAVRRAGGLSIKNNNGLRGEVAGIRGDLKNLVRQNGGLAPDEMARRMQERGFLPDEEAETLFDALRAESRGGRSFSANNDPSRNFAAMRDAAMGDAPGATRVPQKISLAQFDAIRKDIGGSQRAAGLDPERATEALALSRMKDAMDERMNEVVRGDGDISEVLPMDWWDKLKQGQALKREQVAKYRTGPQASAFDRGFDGLPKVQGGEFAGKVWGNRAGIANDIKQFRAVLDDKPELLGKFRSMITTEGAGTATANDELSSKFVRWVDNSLPGLKASFEPEQVKTLQRIAADIKRAGIGASAGMSRGSNTYQNAQNALELGLLDNPLIKLGAERLPLGGFGLASLRESARASQGRRLAEVLANAGSTANALQQAGQRPANGRVANLLASPEIQELILRGAPVVSADR